MSTSTSNPPGDFTLGLLATIATLGIVVLAVGVVLFFAPAPHDIPHESSEPTTKLVSISTVVPDAAATLSASATPKPQPASPETPARPMESAIAAATPDPDTLSRGKALYTRSCATCHATNGTGVRPTGTNLVASDFVRRADESTLTAYIRNGSAPGQPNNKTGMLMPANPALTPAQLHLLVTYIKNLPTP